MLGPLQDPVPGSITSPGGFLMSGGRGIGVICHFFKEPAYIHKLSLGPLKYIFVIKSVGGV